MSFMIGCNYWSSNAGAHMWNNFKPEIIDKDLSILSENGVKYIRAFPIWSIFQPVKPFYEGASKVNEYMTTGNCDNPYYLDEDALSKFDIFLNLCEKNNIKVIIGVVTGWMSGEVFVPTALYNKNIITDPLAAYFTQLFIKGFVPRYKNHPALHAWDLGNECNGMAPVNNRYEAALWVANVANGIRAEDHEHPVYSGMHSLTINGPWSIIDQGVFTDMLTIHPYAIWCDHTFVDSLLSYRTILHPTIQSKYYSDLSGKPCVAEEFGSTGPFVCGDDSSAHYIRFNLFSLWANGNKGLLWWCANDQNMLKNAPYSRCPVEHELGLLTDKMEPKPAMKELSTFSKFLDSLDFELPDAASDAVCILTRDQDHWGAGYMTNLLLRKVGLNCRFAYCDAHIPDASLYLMPSVNGFCVMPMERYDELKEKVRAGADLYISADSPFIANFTEVAGLKVIDSFESITEGYSEFGGKKITFKRKRNILTESTGADVLATDNNGYPFISVNKYGKGRVFFVNAPIEVNLLDKHDAFSENPEFIYSELFAGYATINVEGEDTVFTYHPTTDGYYLVILNTCSKRRSFTIKSEKSFSIHKVYYGNEEFVEPYNACVIKIKY